MTDMPAEEIVIDPKHFRQVLASYPTGVAVITSMDAHGQPIAMVVGSFTSVSLDPPLVGFFPAHSSGTWAKLRDRRHFCVNILSAEQQPLCRRLASSAPDKFSEIAYRTSRLNNPLLEGIVAWLECSVYSITAAGDHDFVLGRVLELDVISRTAPLVFYQGGFGHAAIA